MTISRLLIASAAGALVLAAAAGADGTELRGSVGPGFTISLSTASGARVSQLDKGAYRLVVDDKSPEHNFHLKGPGGVDVATDVEDVGTKSFDVTLVDGTYTFVCDPHSNSMRGTFTVGTASAGSGGSGGPGGSGGSGGASAGGTTTATQRLTLSITKPAVRLTTAAGAAVKVLKAGPVVVTVKDRSAARGARLSGAGAATSTTASFVGTKTWKGTLKAGTLVVSSPGLKALRVKVS